MCKSSDGEDGNEADLKGGENFRLVRNLVKRVVAQREEGGADEDSEDL